MKIKSNGFQFVVATLLLLSLIMGMAIPVSAAESLPSAAAAKTVYLYNFENDEEILVKNRTGRIAPASTVKIAFGLLAIEFLETRLDEVVTITEEMLAPAQGAKLGLELGDRMTVRDLLYCAICGGNNDAVCALAVLIFGSQEDCVQALNQRLAEWGCTATHYKNATGVDDNGMYTTLEDVVTISKKALDSPLYMEISSAKSYVYLRQNNGETTTVHNRNAIISPYYYQGCQSRYAKGLIAGMTDRGGYCVVTYAEYEGCRYLCIVMGASTLGGMPGSFRIAFDLLQFCYNNRLYRQVAVAGTEVCRIPVSLALSKDENAEASLPCILESDLYALISDSVTPSDLTLRTYFYDSPLSAPVEAGTVVGGVDIYDGDRWLGHSRLLVLEEIHPNPLLQALDAMRSFFSSRPFILFVITAFTLLTLYFLLAYLKRRKRNAQRR